MIQPQTDIELPDEGDNIIRTRDYEATSQRTIFVMTQTQTDIELPDEGDNIIRTRDHEAFVNPNGVGHEIFTSLQKNRNKTVQIDAVSGVSETCGQVLERSVRVACHLRKFGVSPKDIITPCTTNHLNTNVILFAIFFTGAKPASTDPDTPEDDKIRQLELVQPKFIFASPKCVDSLENIIKKLNLETKIVVFGKTNRHMSFEEFLVPLPEEEKNFKVSTNNNTFDTALIVFSSGTTGSPKGICITHYQMLAGTVSQSYRIKRHGVVIMSYASLAWVGGLIVSVLSTTGHTRLLCSNFETGKTWEYLEKYKVAMASLVPHDFLSFVNSEKPKKIKLPHLKVISPTGGAVSIETLTKARMMLPTTLVIANYGQTELWGSCLQADFTPTGLIQFLKKPNTCGKPMRGFTYKIVDPETEDVLGPNQPGELRIKTKLVMNGYYKVDSHNRFDSQDFLKTGDIMYYDKDHWFFFVEKLKEMLRYKMCAVAPTELEWILMEHPSVQLAVVLGLPSDEGDIIAAVVVKSDDNVTAEELEDLVAGKVDDRKRLRGGVKFLNISEIPFTPSGKVKRKTLLQYLIQQS